MKEFISIYSKENIKVVEARKLLQRKYRDKENLFIVDSFKVIEEGIKNGIYPVRLFFVENGINVKKDLIYFLKKKCEVYLTSEKIIKSISDVENPQGIIGIYKKINWPLDDITKSDFLLVLNKIKNPGNLGTIIRTADACNIKLIIIQNSVDIYNPKVIRGTMGSIFRTPIFLFNNIDSVLDIFRGKYKIYFADAKGKYNVWDINFNEKIVIILGEETNVDKSIMKKVDTIKIPMIGSIDSLNVAVTGSIFMYEKIKNSLK